jgi:hypothetical protein
VPTRPRKPSSRRGGQPVDPAVRKEKVLHTRVPQSLDRQLKERARNLGLSVSTVVRHVLLNTFGLVEDIVVDSANLAMSIAGDDGSGPGAAPRGRSARDAAAAPDILGWQEVVLNVNGTCERCNSVLRKTTNAAIAIRERPGPRVMLCMGCLDELAAPDTARSSVRTEKKRRRAKTPQRGGER